MKSFAKAALAAALCFLFCIVSADAQTFNYTIGAATTQGTQASVNVSISALPDTATFGQFTIDYDSLDVDFSSATSVNSAVQITQTTEGVATPEQGNKSALVQWSKVGNPGVTATGAIVSVTWLKVACGAAALHMNDTPMIANPYTHAITSNPSAMWSSHPNHGAMATYDGSVTFDCGGGGGGELDKGAAGDSVPVAPASWALVKRVYR